MTITSECSIVKQCVERYLTGSLAPEEKRTMERHLLRCHTCHERVKRHRQVSSLLQAHFPSADAALTVKTGQWAAVVSVNEVNEYLELQSAQRTDAQSGIVDSLPWWLVSGCMHFLVLALASLVTMSIDMPHDDSKIVMITELQQRPVRTPESERNARSELKEILDQRDSMVFDAATKTNSDVVVSPEIFARAELGDRFETIDPELPDRHSAFGTPDSKTFQSFAGSAEPAGGGGTSGLAMEELIGANGTGGNGTGGGFGSGNGVGSGAGVGSGRGTFGQRNDGGRRLMVKKHGGSLATENAVEKALEWLAYHQEPDGHWEIGKYEGYEPMSCGVTGIAVLAFLGAGHNERTGKYRDNVTRAIAWIVSKQGADGSIGEGFKENTPDCGHEGHAYHHAICGLALAEAAGMGHLKPTIEAAQKAVDYSMFKHQGGQGSEKTAWRYSPQKDADSSVSGWFVMQLKSAKIAGLHVDPASFEGALKFYDSVEDKRELNGYSGGRFCYTKAEGVQLNPSAIGILCNLFLGRQASDLTGGAEYLSQNLPTWNKELGDGVEHLKFPMYYSYYGTLAMFQIGGEYWKKWNTAIKSMLLPQQRRDGDFAGSWDPIGGYDDRCGGRVYMTAMSALCLEVYYRYTKL